MRRSVQHLHAVVLTLSLLASGRTIAAQLATSFEIGLPWVDPKQASLDLLIVGWRVGSIKPLALGVDCSIATLPVAMAKQLIVVESNLDLAYPIPLGRRATLTPRAGASALVLGGLASPGGFEVSGGYNAGVGLVGRTGPTTAVRLDITRDWLAGSRGVSIVTIGFVQMH